MQKILISFFTIILLITANSCHTDELEQAMISFDQAFIPVFYYSYTNDLGSAEKAMDVLDSKWKDLQIRFERLNPPAHEWHASFQMVTAWLNEAEQAIDMKNADLALIQLDHARYELMDLRWREGMTYYLDKVWDLEATIDLAVQTGTDVLLDLEEWQDFTCMAGDVNEAWKVVDQADWKVATFGFTKTDKEEEIRRKEYLRLAIEDFMEVIKKGDRCLAEDAVKEMEIAYLNYMFLFGDFEIPEEA